MIIHFMVLCEWYYMYLGLVAMVFQFFMMDWSFVIFKPLKGKDNLDVY